MLAKLAIPADAVKIGELGQPPFDQAQSFFVAVFIPGVSLGLAHHQAIEPVFLVIEPQVRQVLQGGVDDVLIRSWQTKGGRGPAPMERIE